MSGRHGRLIANDDPIGQDHIVCPVSAQRRFQLSALDHPPGIMTVRNRGQFARPDNIFLRFFPPMRTPADLEPGWKKGGKEKGGLPATSFTWSFTDQW